MRNRVLAGLLLACPLCAVAQTADGDTLGAKTEQLPSLTVTESRRQQQLRSTAPLHVLGHGDWLQMGLTDMASALHRLPGITLRDYGGAGGMKTVSVRGFGAQHTGVSYDGLQLSECQSGEIDVSRYSLDNVEQLSLIVGDNDDIFIPARQASMAATLNIETWGNGGLAEGEKTPISSAVRAQLKVGSFGYVSPYVRYKQQLSDRFAMSAMGEYVYAENDYPFTLRNVTLTTREHRTNSRMNQGHAELNFLWKTGRSSELAGKAYYYDNDRQLPGQVRYYTNLSNETLHDRNAFGQLRYQTRWNERWALKWQGRATWSESRYNDGQVASQVQDGNYWQREYYTTACLLYAPTDRWTLDYSADYSYASLNSSLTTDTRPYRHTLLQSVTAKYRTGRLTVLGRLLVSLYLNGARTGASARDMRRLSPSLSASYKVLSDEELYVRASYKNIFRAPTFNESYFFHYGSTNLKPESTDQVNIGVTYQPRRTTDHSPLYTFTLDAYLNHVEDKIVGVPFNMFVWTCINVGKVRTLGLDATAKGSWTLTDRQRLTASANYSLQRVQNRTNPESAYYGNQLAYMPVHSGAFSVGWENPWLNVTLNGDGVSRRWATNEHYDETQIDGYFELGATAWKAFTLRLGKQKRSLEVRFDVKNLLDKQYEIVRLYPMPGRSWMVTVKI